MQSASEDARRRLANVKSGLVFNVATARRAVGIRIAVHGVVLVAIPHFQGRVSPVFDVASRLILVRVQGRAEVGRREVTLFQTQPDGIARCLAELEVNVLICGAITQMLQQLLTDAGVRVVSQVCGELEAVIPAFLSRTLDAPELRLPGCFRAPSNRPAGKRNQPPFGPHPGHRPARGRAVVSRPSKRKINRP